MQIVAAGGLEHAVDEIAVLVVDIAVGDGAVADDDVGIGRVVAVAVAGGQLNVAAVNVGAPDLNGDGVVGIVAVGDDLDGVVAVVAELVVRPRPADRSVKAVGQVVDDEHMAGALNCRHLGEHRRAVYRGGYLADAAADLLHDLTVGICGRSLESGLGGALADGAVEGELLAGVEHKAVELRGAELDIVDARVGAVGVERGLRAELIAEQRSDELLLGHLRHVYLDGDADFLQQPRGVPELLGLGGVKREALDVGNDLTGLLVIVSILRLAHELGVQRLKVGRLDVLRGKRVAHAALQSLESLDGLVVHGLRVERYLTRALDVHHLGGGLVNGVAAVADVLVKTLQRAGDERHDIVAVERLVAPGDIHGRNKAGDIGSEVVELVAAVAVAVCRGGGTLSGQYRAGADIVDAEALPGGELDGHRSADGLVPLLPLQKLKRLLLGQSADVRAADVDARQVRIAGGDGICPQDKPDGDGREQNGDDHKGDDKPLVRLLRLARTLRLFGLSVGFRGLCRGSLLGSGGRAVMAGAGGAAWRLRRRLRLFQVLSAVFVQCSALINSSLYAGCKAL